MSCILPEAYDPMAFWENLLNEKSTIGKISEHRLKHYLLHESEDCRLKIISHLASEISHEAYQGFIKDVKDPVDRVNRLRNYAMTSAKKLMQSVESSPRGKKQDVILGCMNPDIVFELQFLQSREKAHVDLLRKLVQDSPAEEVAVFDEIIERALSRHSRAHIPDPGHYFSSSIPFQIAKDHALDGEQYLVDSACASSLTAIDLAAQRLKLGLSDFAISGGMESNLGQATYMIFSSVGALAPEYSAPFDKKSEGLAQSEGAVFFALKRLGDAVRDEDKILGVIREVAGSSDGRSASLFQPNVEGQKLVYEKIYGKEKKLHYLEAHGTGTQVGDETEMKSITGFFKGERLPVGSVKALVGHTKGAAGATGLLKCLLIMKHRLVPGSSYIKEDLFPDGELTPFINKLKHPIPGDEPLRLGINAFGFGGTNYHLLLEEFRKGVKITEAPPIPEVEVNLVAESSMSLEGFERADFFKYDCPFKLPPKSAAGIDKAQLIALITAWNCIRSLGAPWAWIPKEKINVISACTLALDQVFEIADRLIFETVARYGEAEFKGHPLVKRLRTYVNDEVDSWYAPINEDAATGVLNNVIAGRVSNAFDLFGKSYNIDKDIASVPVAIEAVKHELRLDPDQIFIVIGVEEIMAPHGFHTERKAVTTRILTSKQFAESNELSRLKVFV